MAEYINREALIKTTLETPFTMSMCLTEDECNGMNRAREIYAEIFEILPAADVRPVVHGRWIDMGDFISCSECQLTRLKEFESYYSKAMRLDARANYCPNCGASMDGDGDV